MREIFEAQETVASEEVGIEGISLTNFLRHAKKILRERFPEIMETLADKSVKGSLPHTKYLFEIGGMKEELERREDDDGPSLADMLIEAAQKRRQVKSPEVADGAVDDDVISERGGDCGRTTK